MSDLWVYPSWWALAALLAVEVVVVVGVAGSLQRWLPSPLWRRVAWQGCFLALALALGSTLLGGGRGVVAWMADVKRARSTDSGLADVPPPTSRVVGGEARLQRELAQVFVPGSSPIQGGLEVRGPQGLQGSTSSTQTGVPPPLARDRSEVATALPMGFPPAAVPMGRQGQQAIPTGQVVTPREARREAAVGVAEPGVGSLFLEASDGVWAALWILGTLVVLGRLGMARGLTLAYRRRPVVEDPGLLEMVGTLGRQLGCRSGVRLVTASRLVGPLTFGLFHPTIVLPADFPRRFTAAQQRAILAHELAHVAAGDPWWQLVADFFTAALWWHPLVWRARARLHASDEEAADEASLLVEDGPGVLAECLVALGAQHLAAERGLWLGLAGQGFRSSLGRRVERLLGLGRRAWQPLNPRRAFWLRASVSLAAAFSTVLFTAWVVPQAFTKGDPMRLLQETWKRSLTTVAVAAALGGNPALAAESTPAEPKAAAAPTNATTNAAAVGAGSTDTPAVPSAADLPTVVGDGGAAVQQPVDAQPAGLNMSEEMRKRYGLDRPVRLRMSPELMRRYGLTPPNATPAVEATESADAEEGSPPARPMMSPEMMRRYGLTPVQTPSVPTGEKEEPISPAAKATTAIRPTRAVIERKLDQLRFEAIQFADGTSLREALQMLGDLVRKQDPAGINWVIGQTTEPTTTLPGWTDPLTGQPIPVRSGVAETRLHLSAPLRGLRLRDVLNVLTEVAEPPIHYSVENYGVTFSPGAPQPGKAPDAEPAAPVMSAAMMKRYGLSIGTPPERTPVPDRVARLRAKLETIRCDRFNLVQGVALSQVIRLLDDIARGSDPDKEGINFILSRAPEDDGTVGAVDLTTGIPLAGAAREATVASPVVLHQVCLADILDVLTKVTAPSIGYTLRDYGVVLQLAPTRPAETPRIAVPRRNVGPKALPDARLVARTFEIDSGAFLLGAKAAFGLALPADLERQAAESPGSVDRDGSVTRATVVRLAEQLGVKLRDPDKQVFFNRPMRMLMLRAPTEDLDTLSAAIETLGGRRGGGEPAERPAAKLF